MEIFLGSEVNLGPFVQNASSTGSVNELHYMHNDRKMCSEFIIYIWPSQKVTGVFQHTSAVSKVAFCLFFS